MIENIDINETEVLKQYPEVLEMLLKDHTSQQNIFWATDSYSDRGEGYQFKDAITVGCISGDNGMIIRPRSVKSKDEQTKRSKDMTEVFTPSWVCNAQNNLIDDAWFGKQGVFNSEAPDHTWNATTGKIEFPDGKTWKDYVRDTRLEITCGEAPYLVSCYDTVSGMPIELTERIGLLDRKLRVVSENTETTGEFLDWCQEAYKNTYGYEWQGDNYSYILPQTLSNPNSGLIVSRQGLEDLEVLMLEVNPTDPKKQDQMEAILQNWFSGMGVQKFYVGETDQPSNTKLIIDKFMKE